MSDHRDKPPRQTRSWPSVKGTPEQRASKGMSRLEDITRLMSEWVWETDVDGRLTYASERVTEVLGWLPLQIQGKTFFELGSFVDEQGNEITPNLEKPFRELLFQTKSRNDEERLVQVSGLPFYDRDTWAIEGYCGTVEDITEQRRILKEMGIAKLEAEKANLAKSEFLSSMSHELRTPLNGILGFAQLLDYNPASPLTAKQKDNTNQIIKSGHHLLNLIDQVLELAQIEAEKVFLQIEDVPLNELLQECIPLVESMADKRGITLNYMDADSAGFIVRGDHVRLKQVVLNLLSNAVKYNCDNGSVSINVYMGNEGMMRIAVTDTGLGIAKDKQDGLFEPFDRLGHESSDIEGTGIGLTITRNLVHLMDGEIGFVSEVGRGSTFWVEVPVAAANVPKPINSKVKTVDDFDLSTSLGDATKHYTALYVEDNLANLALIEQILGSVPNLDLISTHTAELGIEMAEAQSPDLVLMDINLPGMDGVEALGRLKSIEGTSHIPVIAITAAAMPDDVAKGNEAGFHTYLTKPLQIDELIRAIRQALQIQ